MKSKAQTSIILPHTLLKVTESFDNICSVLNNNNVKFIKLEAERYFYGELSQTEQYYYEKVCVNVNHIISFEPIKPNNQ